MTTGIDTPEASIIAVVTATTPTIEPTERSMPRVRITKVMPTLTMPNKRDLSADIQQVAGLHKTWRQPYRHAAEHDEHPQQAKALSQPRRRAAIHGVGVLNSCLAVISAILSSHSIRGDRGLSLPEPRHGLGQPTLVTGRRDEAGQAAWPPARRWRP